MHLKLIRKVTNLERSTLQVVASGMALNFHATQSSTMLTVIESFLHAICFQFKKNCHQDYSVSLDYAYKRIFSERRMNLLLQ